MRAPVYRRPFVQLLAAMLAGAALGWCQPALAMAMQPLGTVFIGIIKLLIGPVIFFTVSAGVAGIGGLRQVGRLGLKMLLYFELLSALALLTGLAAAALLRPGAGLHLAAGAGPWNAATPAPSAGPALPSLAETLRGALLGSPLLQVLAAALLVGVALALLGRRGKPLAGACERAAGALLWLVKWVLAAAPLAAFGAIAFTVGKYGLESVTPLLKLIGALYLASAAFIVIVLGVVARLAGFRIVRLIAYVKEELLIVFVTASSVTAMAPLMDKMARAGCPVPIAALVVPAGYSFNLNGSNIYLALALAFLAQASDIELGFGQQLAIVAVAMVTSKGASGVAGSAFVALAATLAAVPAIADSSLLFIVGIERLLKCRPFTNLVGNGVACLAIAAWEGRLERGKLREQGLVAA